MINYILALLIIGQLSINPDFEKKVLEGREAVEKYRKAHDLMYDKSGMKEDRHDELITIMLKELESTGYTILVTERLEAFRKDSRDYNAKKLGYEDKEDFKKNATEQDTQNYLDSWR